MNKILLSLCLVAGAAHADWVRIGSSLKDPALYMDSSAVERPAPNRIRLWNIVDYASVQQHDGKDYRSALVNYEFDCDRGAFRELIRVLHKDAMGSGVTVYWTHGLWSWARGPGAWNLPEQGSVESALVGAGCGA
jgi:hypothetical protein